MSYRIIDKREYDSNNNKNEIKSRGKASIMHGVIQYFKLNQFLKVLMNKAETMKHLPFLHSHLKNILLRGV